MKRFIHATCIVGLVGALGACTLHNDAGEPVVLTSSNARELIAAEMRKGCPALMAIGNAAEAITLAVNAAKETQGIVNTASNMASIGCSLLVKPPGNT